MRIVAVIPLALLAIASPAQSQQFVEIGHTGAWSIARLDNAEGTCRARLEGPPISLVLMINNQDKLVMSAGNPRWDLWQVGIDTTLVVDSGKPRKLQSHALGPLIMATISDDQTIELRTAKNLDWKLPAGEFKVGVKDMGLAIDAVRACQQGK